MSVCSASSRISFGSGDVDAGLDIGVSGYFSPHKTPGGARFDAWAGAMDLRLPVTKEAAVFTIDEGIYWNRFGRSTLTLDTRSGEVVKWEAYSQQNAARQLRSWARFTHTGETGGILGQLIGFIACVGGAFLVFTGISLAIRRFWSWRGKRAAAGNQQLERGKSL